MKHREILSDLRIKDQGNLVAELKTAEKKLLELQFGLRLRKLKQTDQIRKNRKQIARLQTILQEKLTEAYQKELKTKEQAKE